MANLMITQQVGDLNRFIHIFIVHMHSHNSQNHVRPSQQNDNIGENGQYLAIFIVL